MPNLIRSVVVDPTLADRLVIRQVEHPEPLPHEAVVKVAAISLNRGEVRRSQSAEAGWRPGWDLAGTIEMAASDGSGLPVGTRVVGFLPAGAWAERVAVPTDAIAALPDEIDFNTAATLPVAGLTALMALDRGGALLDRIGINYGRIGWCGLFCLSVGGGSWRDRHSTGTSSRTSQVCHSS
jgi:NADPH:quinone reductase